MTQTDGFSLRSASPHLDGSFIAGQRQAPRRSAAGGFVKFVFFAAVLVAAGYGGIQWLAHHQPGAWSQLGEGDSNANSHLPATLPELRVKNRNEPL